MRSVASLQRRDRITRRIVEIPKTKLQAFRGSDPGTLQSQLTKTYEARKYRGHFSIVLKPRSGLPAARSSEPMSTRDTAAMPQIVPRLHLRPKKGRGLGRIKARMTRKISSGQASTQAELGD